MAFFNSSIFSSFQRIRLLDFFRISFVLSIFCAYNLSATDLEKLRKAVKDKKHNVVQLVNVDYDEAVKLDKHELCLDLLNLKLLSIKANPNRSDIMDIMKLSNIHFAHLENAESRANYYLKLGETLLDIYALDLSQIHLLKSVEIYRLTANDKGLGSSYLALSHVYFARGDFDRSLDFALKAKTLLESVSRHDSNYSAIYNQIGKIYLSLGQTDKASSFLRESFEYAISQNDSVLLSDAYYFQARLNVDQLNFSKAEKYLKKSIRIRKGLADNIGLGSSFLMYADLHEKKGDPIKAISDVEWAFKYFANDEDNRMKVHAMVKMAEIQVASNQLMEAENSLFLAGKSLSDFSSIHEELKIRSLLKDIYTVMGDHEKVITQLERYKVLIDSLYGLQQLNSITDVQASYDLQKTELDKLFYKEQWQFSQTKNTYTLIIALLIFCLVFLLYLNIRKNKLLLRKEYTLMEAKKDLAQQELDTALTDLELNKNNLKKLTQNIIKKNVQIQSLGLELDKIKTTEDVGDEKIDHLNELIQFRILTSEDWDEFKKLFDMVYRGFFVKLKFEHPSLTKSEIKLFMVSKLNLSINDTAGLLAISPESVRKARYRLKKKLNLEEEDLSEYILDF